MPKVLWEQFNNLSHKTVCQNIVDTIGRVFSVDLAILLTINPLNQERQHFITYKSAEIFSSKDYEFFKQIALDTESVLVVNDINTDRQWQEKYQSNFTHHQGKVCSVLAVPLTCQHNFQAYISLYSCQKPRIWQQEDVGLAMMMAAQAGLAISQTYAYEDMKALAQREVTLNRITAVIRSSLEPQAIYNAIVTELGTTLEVDGCSLSLWTKNDRYMLCVGLYKSDESLIIPQETKNWQRSTISLVPIADNPLLQRLIKDREPVCLSDLQQEQDLARFDLPWRSQSRALLIVPLIFDGEIMGSITLRETNNSRHWRSSEIELAKAVASQAAIAVNQSRLYETSRRQAIQLQVSENKVKELNNYLTESILKRFLPEVIANQAATGMLTLDLSPEPHLITVLFCDLVGFTKLSSQLEVDILSELLNEYLEAMTQAIFDHSGTVDKFVGDGVMALFGAPEELPLCQQARRAIATAKTMQHYLLPINRKWRAKGVWQAGEIADLQLRCGIHQGRAVVGMFGGKQRKDYTAIGKVVNIAARLQQIASPNSILLSETVFNCLEKADRKETKAQYVKLKGIKPDFCCYSLSMVDS
ncbi:Family 3 adenylate cyclase [Hyella patelloides LEGE 07179]|uniref:Family 3 adenylate cyclase n=1 Tax=Hyella patelloides LEGE 07179 TaxID=945734 RepID=A0A563VRQ0_9CYAN|nr:GAF domain-containing protein [Hyella patelloides]VEP14057.1 Family 3 adenylate cyclase [Hyella patelloides LEGE 07179]